MNLMEEDRFMPEIKGNFACSIQISVKKSKKFEYFIAERPENAVLVEDLHLSLFSEFYLKYYQIASTEQDLKEIKSKPLFLHITESEVAFQNATKSKYFIGLEVKYTKSLKSLVSKVESILNARSIKRNFDSAFIPHISFYFTREKPSTAKKEGNVIKILHVDHITFKAGKKDYKIPLN